MRKVSLLLVLLISHNTLFGYLGPGMSGGLIATILGIIGSILLAIFGVIYYPLKRWFNKRKRK